MTTPLHHPPPLNKPAVHSPSATPRVGWCPDRGQCPPEFYSANMPTCLGHGDLPQSQALSASWICRTLLWYSPALRSACTPTHTFMHAHTHARPHSCTHTHIHAHMHACMHAHMHARTHACTHTCIHPHMHARSPWNGHAPQTDTTTGHAAQPPPPHPPLLSLTPRPPPASRLALRASLLHGPLCGPRGTGRRTHLNDARNKGLFG